MIYVSRGTLNSTHSLTHSLRPISRPELDSAQLSILENTLDLSDPSNYEPLIHRLLRFLGLLQLKMLFVICPVLKWYKDWMTKSRTGKSPLNSLIMSSLRT